MEDSLFSVAGQVVLVPGASRGIGRALAEGFAARGAQVIIAGRDADSLDKTASEISSGTNPVKPVVCDVAKPEDVAALVDSTLSAFGRIDTLVSVAGVNKRMKAEDYSAEEYDWIMDINLRGSFILAQAVGRHMIERKSGSIVNVDSLNTYAPLTGVTPYAMSKAGVLMMTRALANEWGRHNVRVNSIAPGFFPTALSQKLWAQDKMRDWAEQNTPMGKLGEVKDLVGAAIFLASEAAAFITGQTIRVDGGVTAGINWPIDL
ncbi:MAG: glucose 1-dehydrogenase [Burkholderiales bacterium]|jgi:NAD(P)-dependent dehydrogenase (short-subunit alcohol dehydrogenase family)